MSASATSLLDDLIGRLQSLDEKALQEVVEPALKETEHLCWVPNPGPQTMALETEADELFYGGSAGGGKGLALDTPIPTPEGWINIGDIEVGDTVFDENGAPCHVTAVSEVNHRACYRLIFDDGSTIVADDVHRWVTFDAKELSDLTRRNPEWRAARREARASRAKGNKSELFRRTISERNSRRAVEADAAPLPEGTMRDTKALRATLLTARGRRNHAIKVCGALDTANVALPVPPYTLGAWLGDGASRNGQLTSADPQVWERIESDGFEVRHYDWSDVQHSIIGLKEKLRTAGVLENKHIPEMYLRASVDQRLDLLKGLMDADGHAALDGGCEFDGTNERLVDGVLELARSLGIKATKTKGVAKLDGRVIGDKFRVKFVTTLSVFALTRKLSRLSLKVRRTARFRYLVSCEPVESVPTRCISVDSPSHQYLAGEAMIPTHNSDLLIGAALTRHRRALLLREFGKDAKVMAERAIEIRGNRDGFAMSPTPSFRDMERSIDFGGCRDTSEMQRHKGVPYDLFGFDEITDFSEVVFRFIKTWNRTTAPGQRCRVICTGNPPTDADGAWIIDYWGPWLDPRHPNPAAPGELRWFTTSEDGKEDVEVDGPGPHIIGGKEVYARSRTYIPAALEDNPDLTRDGQYRRVLDSLSGVFRSAYRDGDFMAAMSDEAGQLIPTWWVLEAQKRWTSRPTPGVPMSAVAADVAQGGPDSNVIATRYDGWYAELIEIPGEETPVGTDVAPHIITARKNGAPVIIDCGGGYGGSVVKTLRENDIEAIAYKGSDASSARSRDGNNLKFANKRAEVLWRFREALNPDQPFGSPIALPPDRKLAAELCAFTWEPTASGVRIGSQDKLVEKLGRSPDRAVAVVLCWAAGEHNISYLYSGAGPSAEDGIPGRYGRPGLQKRANVKTRYNRR